MTKNPHVPCSQQCGAEAEVYAVDPCPDGWGGHYCEPCAESLRFTIIDTYSKENI